MLSENTFVGIVTEEIQMNGFTDMPAAYLVIF